MTDRYEFAHAAFVRWADKQPAVTWGGKLGLRERWMHRDDPEYQAMLERMGTR